MIRSVRFTAGLASLLCLLAAGSPRAHACRPATVTIVSVQAPRLPDGVTVVANGPNAMVTNDSGTPVRWSTENSGPVTVAPGGRDTIGPLAPGESRGLLLEQGSLRWNVTLLYTSAIDPRFHGCDTGFPGAASAPSPPESSKGLPERALDMAMVWAVLSPFWLLTLAALAWGRVSLSRNEIRNALAWTIGASLLLAFPAAWAILASCAGYASAPSASPAVTGGLYAAMLLPVYSALVACAAFELPTRSAERRGGPRRSGGLRTLAGVVIAAAVALGLVVLATACFLAAGPKALG